MRDRGRNLLAYSVDFPVSELDSLWQSYPKSFATACRKGVGSLYRRAQQAKTQAFDMSGLRMAQRTVLEALEEIEKRTELSHQRLGARK